MALEKVPPLKEVLAGRVRQDLAEDIYILQYRHEKYPDEIAEDSKRIWLWLYYKRNQIMLGEKFNFCVTVERAVKKVKNNKIVFGVEIFGPVNQTFDITWQLTEEDQKVLKRMKKTDTGRGLLNKCFDLDTSEFPAGEYKINLVSIRDRQDKGYSNYVVVPDRERFTILAPKVEPPKPVPKPRTGKFPCKSSSFYYFFRLLLLPEIKINHRSSK